MQRLKRISSILLLTVLILSLGGCSKVDAEELAQATLDLRLQGEADSLAKMLENKSKSELRNEYSNWIYAICEVYITGDMEVDDELQNNYESLMKQILSCMRYSVKSSEKDGNEYKVTVQITPVDLFERYVEDLQVLSADLQAQADAGEYEGTDDEITGQMQAEYLYMGYEALLNCFTDMEYGDPENIVLTIDKAEDGEYCVNEDSISELVIKILRLDKIQD